MDDLITVKLKFSTKHIFLLKEKKNIIQGVQ